MKQVIALLVVIILVVWLYYLFRAMENNAFMKEYILSIK